MLIEVLVSVATAFFGSGMTAAICRYRQERKQRHQLRLLEQTTHLTNLLACRDPQVLELVQSRAWDIRNAVEAITSAHLPQGQSDIPDESSENEPIFTVHLSLSSSSILIINGTAKPSVVLPPPHRFFLLHSLWLLQWMARIENKLNCIHPRLFAVSVEIEEIDEPELSSVRQLLALVDEVAEGFASTRSPTHWNRHHAPSLSPPIVRHIKILSQSHSGYRLDADGNVIFHCPVVLCTEPSLTVLLRSFRLDTRRQFERCLQRMLDS